MGGEVEVGRGGEDEEMVEVGCGAFVAAVGVLVVAVVVERVDLVEGQLGGEAKPRCITISLEPDTRDRRFP